MLWRSFFFYIMTHRGGNADVPLWSIAFLMGPAKKLSAVMGVIPISWRLFIIIVERLITYSTIASSTFQKLPKISSEEKKSCLRLYVSLASLCKMCTSLVMQSSELCTWQNVSVVKGVISYSKWKPTGLVFLNNSRVWALPVGSASCYWTQKGREVKVKDLWNKPGSGLVFEFI